MGRFSSNKTIVNQSSEKIFNFLTNLNHFKSLLPDQIKNWHSTENWCTFNIEGMTDLGFQIVEKIEYSTIKFKEYGKSPFPFILTVDINTISSDKSQIELIFEADMNPMMKMMLKKPLTNLLNMMADKLNNLNL